MSALPDTLPASPNGDFTTDVFAAHLATQSDLPAWWLEAKKAAWNQFLALPCRNAPTSSGASATSPV